MRTLHCRSVGERCLPVISFVIFFSLPLGASPAFLRQSPVCGVTAPCCIACFFFVFAFVFFPRAHLTMRGIHTIMTCDRMSSADLVPPPPIPPSVPHPPTDATPAPSCTHPAESCCLPDVNGARLIVSAEGIGPSVVLQHGGNTPHLVVTGLNSPPPVVLNDLVFLFHIFFLLLCVSWYTSATLFGAQSCLS